MSPPRLRSGPAVTFMVLSEEGTELAEEAVVAALREDDPAVHLAAARVAIGWGRDVGLLESLQRWESLPEDLRDALCERMAHRREMLREALHHRERSMRLAAAEILLGQSDPAFIPLMASALVEVPPLREAMAARFLAIANTRLEERRALRESFGDATPAAEQAMRASEQYQVLFKRDQECLAACEIALKSVHLHQCREVLLAMLLFGAEGEERVLAFLDRQDMTARHLEVQLQSLEHESVGRLLARGCFKTERSPVPETIAGLIARNHHPEVWRGFAAALMERGQQAVLARVQKLGRVPWWALFAAHVTRTPAMVLRMHLKLIPEVYPDPLDRLDRYRALLGAPDAAVVREVIDKMRAARIHGWEEGLIGVFEGEDEQAQQLALNVFATLPEPVERNRLLAVAVRSRFEAVRNQAADLLTSRKKEAYLAGFESMDEHTRQIAGQAIAKLDQRFARQVADSLQNADAPTRLKALKVIMAIDKADELQGEILTLLKDPDQVVRAHVVSLLAAFGTPEAIKSLLAALNDPDRRVKANAIEAFETLGNPKVAGVLLPFLRHPDNRVRGNAAKALHSLGRPEALEVLLSMCEDDHELMRASGAWGLGETVGLRQRELLERLRDHDPSEMVRNRARLVLEALAQEAAGEGRDA